MKVTLDKIGVKIISRKYKVNPIPPRQLKKMVQNSSIEQIAEELGLHTSTVYRRMKEEIEPNWNLSLLSIRDRIRIKHRNEAVHEKEE